MSDTSAQAPDRSAVAAMFERRKAAWARLDAAGLAADYAADAVIESPFAGRHAGSAAQASLEKFFGSFTGLTIAVGEAIIDGAHVAHDGIIAGSGTRGLMGLPPTDQPFRIPGAVFYELRGLQIVHERRIYDATGLWVQSGLLKVKPS